MSDDFHSIIRRHEALKQNRVNWLNWWQEIAYRVMPSAATFTVQGPEGVKRIERQYSGRPVIANERFAAVLDDLMTPRNQIWHSLEPEDEDLADSHDVKVYLDKVNKALFAQRYRPNANFASQKSQGYLSIGAFGNSLLFIDEIPGEGARYRNIAMGEVTWGMNHQGMVDTIHRCFQLEARQAAQQFGKYLPPRVKAQLDEKPFEKSEYLHCIQPNHELIPSRVDYRGMAYSSYYVSIEDKSVIMPGGYRTFPAGVGRYMLHPGESYARSPAMGAWGAILTINEEKKSILRAGQREVSPPLLLSDDGALDGFNARSDALNFGALSEDGTPLVQPLKTGANIPLGLELMEIEGMEIDDSFLISIFKVLTDNPQMTATQVLEIVQQKAALIAPVMGRQVAEDLGPMIERELDILARQTKNAWISQEMPDELRAAGGLYKVRYTSPLARAMRSQDGVAIMRTLEAAGGAIGIDPDAALVMDIPESLRELSEINGVPPKLIRDPKVVAQMKEQRAQENAVAQASQVAPAISQAALNAAKAEQLRTGA